MKNEAMTIRVATPADAEEILAIYAPYVLDTAVTFEYDVPSVEEFAHRIERVLERYPYLVAVKDGHIVGYAYVSRFRERSAYGWSVETTVYVQQEQWGKGVGKKLYLLLEEILKEQNVLNMNACIAYADHADPHLTNASVVFHEHLGYTLAGHLHQCGYKFDTWYDMVWMEKSIGEHRPQAEPVRSFSEVRNGFGL